MSQALRDALDAAGLQPSHGTPWGQNKEHTKYVLPKCPFNTHTQPNKACVLAFQDGGVTIRCLSTQCKGKRWKDLCAVYPALAAHAAYDHLKGRPKVIRMDSVKPRPIEWLWPGRIARHKVTLWFGEPGVGKGKAACAVTGGLTSGRGLPDAPARPPSTVLYCSTEDAFDDTLQPRLVQEGADLTRVHAVEAPFTLDAKGLIVGNHVEA